MRERKEVNVTDEENEGTTINDQEKKERINLMRKMIQ
jgi:hypothetical protein